MLICAERLSQPNPDGGLGIQFTPCVLIDLIVNRLKWIHYLTLVLPALKPFVGCPPIGLDQESCDKPPAVANHPRKHLRVTLELVARVTRLEGMDQRSSLARHLQDSSLSCAVAGPMCFLWCVLHLCLLPSLPGHRIDQSPNRGLTVRHNEHPLPSGKLEGLTHHVNGVVVDSLCDQVGEGCSFSASAVFGISPFSARPRKQ